MTGSAAALVSFVESSDLLSELTGVEVSASQVERAAEAFADRTAQSGLVSQAGGLNSAPSC